MSCRVQGYEADSLQSDVLLIGNFQFKIAFATTYPYFTEKHVKYVGNKWPISVLNRRSLRDGRWIRFWDSAKKWRIRSNPDSPPPWCHGTGKTCGQVANGLHRIEISSQGKNKKSRKLCPVKWKMFPKTYNICYLQYFLRFMKIF